MLSNEDEHVFYTFRTTFDLTGYSPGTASLTLPTSWLDDCQRGFGLKGVFTPFTDIGLNAPGAAANDDPYIDPDPRLLNGADWSRNCLLRVRVGMNFVAGLNTFNLVISGNSRSDGILASGFVTTTAVPEPASAALIDAGLLGLAGVARRRQSA